MCNVSECYHEALLMSRPWPTGGCCATGKKSYTNTVQRFLARHFIVLKHMMFTACEYHFMRSL
jgi:hypothetical protein